MAAVFRPRRSVLFLPGSNPKALSLAENIPADVLVFDLEDAVAPENKEAARRMTADAVADRDYHGKELIIRINGLDTPHGLEDIAAVVAGGADAVRLPKTDSPEDLVAVEKAVEAAERRFKRPVGSVKLFAAIESARGILSVREIATASKRLVAIAIGAEDFVTDMHTSRSPDGIELLAARRLLVMAARAAGILAIDTVFTGVDDEEGFLREAHLAKQLGFDGKSVIHPSQVALIHSVYTPSDAEVSKARRVVAAAADAEAKGSGVISLDGKMVDKPIVERALRVLALAGEVEA